MPKHRNEGVRGMRRGLFFLMCVALVALATACPTPPGTTTPPLYPDGVERISLRFDGSQTTDNLATFHRPAVSANGRYVAFDHSGNLVPDDTNGVADVYVHDRQTGLTELVSVGSDGTLGTRQSSTPAISADGRFVAFESQAAEFHPGDAYQSTDVFVHDRLTGTTTRLSNASDGGEPNGFSNSPAISADGTKIAYWSGATNLTTDGSGVQYGEDLFVYDMATGTNARAHLTPGGEPADMQHHDNVAPASSADGRFIAFDSLATNLVPLDTNRFNDVFVHDMVTGSTTLVSKRTDGTQADRASLNPRLSADGRYVVFGSWADNLTPGPTVGPHVFVHDLVTGETTRESVAGDGTPADRPTQFFDISADGRYVSFSTDSTNLAAGDTTGNDRVYVHDRSTGATTRVPSTPGFRPSGPSDSHSISADGRTVVFWSLANNLVPLDTNGVYDLFVYDLHA